MAKTRKTLTRSFGWAELLNASHVECAWHGKNGERKPFVCEVLEVGEGRIVLKTERGKVFVRPLPTAVVSRVLARSK